MLFKKDGIGPSSISSACGCIRVYIRVYECALLETEYVCMCVCVYLDAVRGERVPQRGRVGRARRAAALQQSRAQLHRRDTRGTPA